MDYILDIVIILCFAVCVFTGYKRGFVKALTGLVSNLISVIAARILSAQLAPQVYSNYFEKNFADNLTEKVASLSGNASAQIDSALSSIPGISGFMTVAGVDQASAVDNVAKQINEGGVSAVDALMTNIVSPVATFMIRVVIFVIAFVVCLLVMKLLSFLLNKLAKLPVLKQFNKSLGFVFGVFEGLILVAVVSAVMLLIAGFTGDGGFSQLVANSKIITAVGTLIGTINI